MNLYKVMFKDNIPESASRIAFIDCTNILKITNHDDHKYLDWLVVSGDNENDALKRAGKLIRTIWARYLR